MFCATCGSHEHYTGQIKCRLYPRSEAPPPKNTRPRPLPQQTQTSPQRPSSMEFPPLHQNVWTKNPITQKPMTSDILNTDTESNQEGQNTDSDEQTVQEEIIMTRMETKIIEATNRAITESKPTSTPD